jgi:S1-C subfamily serine protease
MRVRAPAAKAAPKAAPKPKAQAAAGAEGLAPVRLAGRTSATKRPLPPHKPKNTGLMIGLGVGGAAIVVLIGIFIYVAVSGNGTPPPDQTTQGPETPGPETTATQVSTPPETSSVPLPVTSKEPMEPSALFARVSPAVGRIDVMNAEYKKRSQGSGFLVSPDGVLVTNHHVMHAGRRGLVRFGDGKTFPVAAVLAADKDKDLAVLKITCKDRPYLEVLPQGEKPKVGERAFAVGTPVGYDNTFSEGLVSGLREQENRSVVQTTAAISSGSSGGPLLDARGRVLGVNTYIRVERRGDTIVENINFAVASDEVHEILQKAIRARSQLANVESQPLDDAAADEVARAYELLSKDEMLNAAGIAEGLAKRFPNNAQVRLLEARINMRMNFTDQAIEAFRAAARINPNEAEAHLGIGVALSKKKQWKEAVDPLQKAVDLSPADPIAQRALGVALLKLDRKDKALTALKEAVHLEEQDGKAWMALGDAYLAHEFWESAEDAFAHAVALNPHNALAHARLAMAAFRAGHLNHAAQAAAAANKLDRTLPYAYYVMGLLLNRAGEKDRLEQLTKILEQLDADLATRLADEVKATPAETPSEKPDVQQLPDFTKIPDFPEKKPGEEDEGGEDDEGDDGT